MRSCNWSFEEALSTLRLFRSSAEPLNRATTSKGRRIEQYLQFFEVPKPTELSACDGLPRINPSQRVFFTVRREWHRRNCPAASPPYQGVSRLLHTNLLTKGVTTVNSQSSTYRFRFQNRIWIRFGDYNVILVLSMRMPVQLQRDPWCHRSMKILRPFKMRNFFPETKMMW